jgi:F-type H+-transporting ATPase subunit gamma
MPSLIDIRRRIRAVKSTQQITKAMKMVAASRLRKSQERIVSARPYGREMLRVLQDLASRTDPTGHPLLAQREEKSALVIVITGDKGLCGSFNTNIIKTASQFILGDERRTTVLSLVGRKGRDFFRRRGFSVGYERVNLFQNLHFDDARAIGHYAAEAFTEGRVDAVYLAYNEFKSVLQQKPTIEQLLPVPRATLDHELPAARVDYVYEPDAAALFGVVLPAYVDVRIWTALLESNAAQNAAQMTAMDAATNNAADMIDALTLYMNKVRQAAITREIIEVVSGAQAL